MKLRLEWGQLRFLFTATLATLLPMLGNAQNHADGTVLKSKPSVNAGVAVAAPSSPTGNAHESGKGMLVRISEIQIEPSSLSEYNAILKEEAEASVRLEPGVIAIFPMSQKDNPAAVRIVEIYANRDAYEAHLKTPHFQKYKVTTLNMVVSLKLVDMEATDPATMAKIFLKMMRVGESGR